LRLIKLWLLFQALQALLNAAFESQLVAIDLINTQRSEVVDGALDDFRDVTDQEQGFQQQDIECFKYAANTFLGVVDRVAHGAFKKTLNRRIKRIKRHQPVDPPVGIANGGGLEGIEQRALAFGQVACRWRRPCGSTRRSSGAA
jgi:hypothetical protein